MLLDADVSERIKSNLLELHITPSGDLQNGGSVTLTRKASRQTFRVVTPGDAADRSILKQLLFASPDLDRVLVIAGHLNPREITELQAASIDYADASGNANLEFGEVFIHVQGRRPRRTRSRTATASAAAGTPPATNLFSPGRAQVIFALLSWPSLLERTIREIAEASRVSEGAAHQTIELLEKHGYIARTSSHRVWIRRSDASALWLATYPTGLGQTLTLKALHGDVLDEEGDLRRPNTVDNSSPLYVGGESVFSDLPRAPKGHAERLLKPTTLTLYVESFDPKIAIANHWRADGSPNVFIRRKFWRETDGTDGPTVGIREVPALLTIADLLASGDPRQFATARLLQEELHVGSQ